MRLSPKSIFIALIAVGLPVAVAVGWTLGGRQLVSEPPPAAAPAGAGTLGTAPVSETRSPEPGWMPGSYDSRPGGSAATPAPSSPALPTAITPPTSATATPRGPLVTLTTLPPLTDPPVPTPTTVTSEPTPPTATPSDSTSETPDHGGFGAGLLGRR